MLWITEAFEAAFMLRALVGGGLVAVMCSVVGTWVIIRGLAFLGEAMAHGMLPGVALAALLGVPAILGAAASAVVMSVGVGFAARRGRLSHDTSIGLLFVGMLAIGVIIVSRSRSFATDLTAILFGDVLAVRLEDLIGLLAAAVLTIALAAVFHRSFLALAFDARVAETLGLRPRIAQVALIGLVTLAVVASYQAVGTLLVVGLLVGPAAAARPWVNGIPGTMLLASVIGVASVVGGLLLSWHAGTAAGASIAVVAVSSVASSAVLRSLLIRLRGIRRLSPQKGSDALA